MKSKQARQQREAGKTAFLGYIQSLIDECHANDRMLGCPDCRHAYEHAIRYYRRTWQEN